MTDKSINSKRIAQNTLMLYIRMLLLMGVNLYTSRVILQSLGVEDYGIYNAVGGFVAMFSMISTSLSGAIGRFINIALAKDSLQRQQTIFSTALIIQVFICIILIVLGETIGVWFLNSQMIIPEKRLIAANWVLQFSILTFAINLISVPYNALIIAHEKMAVFAYIGIFEGLACLGIAFLIFYSPFDSLIYYSILMCLVSIIIRILYGSYSAKHFPESKFKYILDKQLIKEMFGFSGWNFIGTTSGVLRSQGINILINIFCGPTINAARGIAMQVETAISKFTSNFMLAVRPQITTLFALGDKEGYENLVFKSTKFSFIILILLCLPVISEAEFIMSLWLIEVPEYAVEFVQAILFLTLSEAFSYSLIHLLLATGNIKRYQILVGGMQLLNFPIAYILLKIGMSPVSTVISTIFISWGCLILRLSILHKMLQFPVYKFCTQIVGKSIILIPIALLVPIIIHNILPISWIRFITNLLIIEIVIFASVFIFILSPTEKKFIFDRLSYIKKMIK